MTQEEVFNALSKALAYTFAALVCLGLVGALAVMWWIP